MPWSTGWGKNAIETWVANALGFFYVEYDVAKRFDNKKHAVIFKKMTEELELFIQARVERRLKEMKND